MNRRDPVSAHGRHVAACHDREIHTGMHSQFLKLESTINTVFVMAFAARSHLRKQSLPGTRRPVQQYVPVHALVLFRVARGDRDIAYSLLESRLQHDTAQRVFGLAEYPSGRLDRVADGLEHGEAAGFAHQRRLADPGLHVSRGGADAVFGGVDAAGRQRDA